jgi:hypothetical protein
MDVLVKASSNLLDRNELDGNLVICDHEQLQVSRQPARTEAVEHGNTKTKLHCRIPLPSKGYVKT